MPIDSGPGGLSPLVTEFVRACAANEVDVVRRVLQREPRLARDPVSGTTAMHLGVDEPEMVRLLLGYGADPNVRDVSDNATPLHLAAGRGRLESVRILLDAGADVHGTGDRHEAEVIGWAARRGNEAVVNLLLERGARHHIFSAMAMGDLSVVRELVEEDQSRLLRRRSRFEDGHTALHAAFAPPDGLGWLCGGPDYVMLEHLIRLGADVEAEDGKGRSPLALAMLRGDRAAMRLLKDAGATEPQPERVLGEESADWASTVEQAIPMFFVKDINATVRWYESVGFTVEDRYQDGGDLTFVRLSFGNSELTLSPGGDPGPRDVRLWFSTPRIQELYRQLRARQLEVARSILPGEPESEPEVNFHEDLYEPFYGGYQFSVSDNNGLILIFWQADGRAQDVNPTLEA